MTAVPTSHSSMSPLWENKVGRRVLTSMITWDASNTKHWKVSQSVQAWSTVGEAIWDLHRHTALEKELELSSWQMQKPRLLLLGAILKENYCLHPSCTRGKNCMAVSLGQSLFLHRGTRTIDSQTNLGIVEQFWVQHAGMGSGLFNTKRVLQHKAWWRMLWSRAQDSVSMACGAQRMQAVWRRQHSSLKDDWSC